MNAIENQAAVPAPPPREVRPAAAPVDARPALGSDRLAITRPAPAGAPEPSLWSRVADAAGWLSGGLATVLSAPVSLIAGNLGIVWAWKRLQKSNPQPPIPAAIPRGYNLHVVDDRLWRGSAPKGMAAYKALKEAGVTTIVDLRTLQDSRLDRQAIEALGLKFVNLPIRDGQIPSEAQVAAFMRAVEASGGKTYVHCQAGVGRTGSMVGSYLVKSGQATADQALERVLAVGPPSLEQISYIRALEREGYHAPSPFLVGVSRVLDAPRRIWSRIKHKPVVEGVLKFVGGL